MPFTLNMPKLSPTMEEGTIVRWHKKEGDFVAVDDLLFEVATDKATVEYTALDEGFLRKILVEADHLATVNQPVAIFTETEDESIKDFDVAKKPEASTPEEDETPQSSEAEKSEKKPSGLQQPLFAPEAPLENYDFNAARNKEGQRIKVSPLARRLAKEKGLDLTTVKGTGPSGRIIEADLELAQPSGLVAFSRNEIPNRKPGSYREEKLSPLRQVISERLQEAKTFIPHFYVEMEIDAEPITVLRAQLKQTNVNVSVNDFIVRATALALREHPGVNAAFNSQNNTIVIYETIDISIAVGIPDGLITPIVRHADFKNIGELSLEIKQLRKRAAAGTLESVEYKGGSFTISNLGMYGVKNFQAIINPPQAAILAVSGIVETPVVEKGKIVAGKRMSLCLSADHRVVDGVLAAQFLQTLKHLLEQPAALLL